MITQPTAARFAALRSRNFSLLFTGLIVSNTGTWMQNVAGVAATVLGTMIATYLQVDAPPELRGRVMSLYAITLIGLPSLGALGTGAFAEWLGGTAGAPRAVPLSADLLAVVAAALAPFFLRRDKRQA